MAKFDYQQLYRNAISQYLNNNQLHTEYETSFSWNKEEGCLGVFDLPANYVPFASGGIDDSPEYKVKPVLIARLLPDNSVTVNETEHTVKYLKQKTETDVA